MFNTPSTPTADRLSRFTSAPTDNLYNHLKSLIPSKRQSYINSGHLPDPSNPTSLNQAISFIGTCTDMCPEFERHEREYQKRIDPLELLIGTTDRIDHTRAVKMYHRPAAGNEQPMPCDVRPPPILLQTLNYLFNTIQTQNLPRDCHAFLRDRTRSIRQDFTYQNDRSYDYLLVCERCIRFHIVSLYWMRSESTFSKQQEMEQLRKVMQTLLELYEMFPEAENAAEFYSLFVVLRLEDSGLWWWLEGVGDDIVNSRIMVHTLEGVRLWGLRKANIQWMSKWIKWINNRNTLVTMAMLMLLEYGERIGEEWVYRMNRAFSKRFGMRKDRIEWMMECIRGMGIRVEETEIVFGERNELAEAEKGWMDSVVEEWVEQRIKGKSYSQLVNESGLEESILKRLGKPTMVSSASPVTNGRLFVSQSADSGEEFKPAWPVTTLMPLLPPQPSPTLNITHSLAQPIPSPILPTKPVTVISDHDAVQVYENLLSETLKEMLPLIVTRYIQSYRIQSDMLENECRRHVEIQVHSQFIAHSILSTTVHELVERIVWKSIADAAAKWSITRDAYAVWKSLLKKRREWRIQLTEFAPTRRMYRTKKRTRDMDESASLMSAISEIPAYEESTRSMSIEPTSLGLDLYFVYNHMCIDIEQLLDQIQPALCKLDSVVYESTFDNLLILYNACLHHIQDTYNIEISAYELPSHWSVFVNDKVLLKLNANKQIIETYLTTNPPTVRMILKYSFAFMCTSMQQKQLKVHKNERGLVELKAYCKRRVQLYLLEWREFIKPFIR